MYLPKTPEISANQIKYDLYDSNMIDGESKTIQEDNNIDPQ